MSSTKLINRMDSVLQFVNANYISLQDDEKKYYMKHYQAVIDKLVELMKKEDVLFNKLFQNFFWAGSFYDGLKVGKPEEFDVDVVIKLPINYDTVEFVNNNVKPPFVKVKMLEMKKLTQSPLWTDIYRYMEKWTDKDGFLLQGEFRQWMESAVNKALLSLPKVDNASELDIDGNKYLITLKKTGPAMTLNITMRDVKLDVDLVPVIEFKSPKKWPPSPVRKNTTPKRESWLIVPKPNSRIQHEYQDTYWRLAFHEQEREMITGNEMGHLKNACRLLKKFRDKNGFKSIASYYIKTMFLWEIEQKKNGPAFWQSSLNNVFITMLKMLAEHIKLGRIDYFWDKRYNLISAMSELERKNVENRINKILKDIEKKSAENPKVIASHILTPAEWTKFDLKFPDFPVANGPVVNEAQPALLVAVDVPIVTADTDGGASLENVMKLLNAVLNAQHRLREDLILERKLTQTILNKVTNLQQSIFTLTEENAMLRDEVKLFKLSSQSQMLVSEETNMLSSFVHGDVDAGSANGHNADLLSSLDQVDVNSGSENGHNTDLLMLFDQGGVKTGSENGHITDLLSSFDQGGVKTGSANGHGFAECNADNNVSSDCDTVDSLLMLLN